MKTMYKLFDTIEEYNELNIEIAAKLDLPRLGTERYATDTPETDVSGKFVMEILREVQEVMEVTDLIDGYDRAIEEDN